MFLYPIGVSLAEFELYSIIINPLDPIEINIINISSPWKNGKTKIIT